MLGRGQFLATYRSLAQEWGWSKSRVERFLKLLQNEGMIDVTVRGKRSSIITICNYDKFQRPDAAQPLSTEAHFRKLSALRWDKNQTAYNESNKNEEINHNNGLGLERGRQLLAQLLAIPGNVIDKSAIRRGLSDMTEPRRWKFIYDWDGHVVPVIQRWAERNKRKASPTTIRARAYFTIMLETEFRKKQRSLL